jgi:hypothetical protein
MLFLNDGQHQSCHYIFLLLQQLVAIVLAQTNLSKNLTTLTYVPTQHLFILFLDLLITWKKTFMVFLQVSFQHLLGDFELFLAFLIENFYLTTNWFYMLLVWNCREKWSKDRLMFLLGAHLSLGYYNWSYLLWKIMLFLTCKDNCNYNNIRRV